MWGKEGEEIYDHQDSEKITRMVKKKKEEIENTELKLCSHHVTPS